MNAEITRIRTELNEAIYIMIDADSDKRYNIAERHVNYLRRTLHQALKDWLSPRTCNYCGNVLGGNEIVFCLVCSDNIEEDDDYEAPICELCGDELHDDGGDYCVNCWDDLMEEDEAETA